MDTQHNHSQNLDPQETLAQEYALQKQQSNKNMPSGNKGPGFGIGMLVGILGTLLVVMTVGVAARMTYIQKDTATADQSEVKKQKDTDTSKNAINQKDVKEKAADLADLIDQYYYEKVDRDALVEGMYAGMVEGLGSIFCIFFSRRICLF